LEERYAAHGSQQLIRVDGEKKISSPAFFSGKIVATVPLVV
jgi:hypothetical protein